MAQDNTAGLASMLAFLQQGSNPGQDQPLPEMRVPQGLPEINLPDPHRRGSGVLSGILGNLASSYIGGKLQTHMDNEEAKTQGEALAPVIDEQLKNVSKDSPFYSILLANKRMVTSGQPTVVKAGLKSHENFMTKMGETFTAGPKNHLQVINDEKGNSYYVDTASGGAAVPINGPGGSQIRSPQYYGPAISNRVTSEQTPQIVQTTDAQGHPIFVTKGQAAGVTPEQPQPLQPSSSNNNYGNIRPVNSKTGFQSFKTPEEGVAAIDKQLQLFGSEHGVNTLAGVFTRWAPPEDHNDTAALIAEASRVTGLKPNDKIDLSNPATRAVIMAPIIKQESAKWKQPPATPMLGQSPTEQAVSTASALLPYKQQEEVNKAQVDIQKLDAINTNKTQTDLNKTVLEKQADIVSPDKIKGRDSVSMLLNNLSSYYNELDKLGGVPNTEKGIPSNMAAAFNTSDTGQFLGRAMGSKDQAIRDKIAAAKSTLVPQVMKATGMTSQMLNSEMELQNFLKTLTDPKVDVSVAKQQLKTMDSLYGKSSLKGNDKAESEAHPGYSGLKKTVGGVTYKQLNDGGWER